MPLGGDDLDSRCMDTLPPAELRDRLHAELLRSVLAELPPEGRRRVLARVGPLLESLGLDDEADAVLASWLSEVLRG